MRFETLTPVCPLRAASSDVMQLEELVRFSGGLPPRADSQAQASNSSAGGRPLGLGAEQLRLTRL